MRVLLAPVVIALIACSLGRPGTGGFSVTVINATDQQLTYFARGVGERPDSKAARGVALAPGATDIDHWLQPDSSSGSRTASIHAVNATGEVVFCRDLRWDELKREFFEVRITVGVIRCARVP